MKVTIHLNTSAPFWSYQPDAELIEAVSYTDHQAGRAEEALSLAYELFNIGEPHEGPYGDVVARYRDAQHRSLSVGDVVTVDGRRFACEPMGWKELV